MLLFFVPVGQEEKIRKRSHRFFHAHHKGYFCAACFVYVIIVIIVLCTVYSLLILLR